MPVQFKIQKYVALASCPCAKRNLRCQHSSTFLTSFEMTPLGGSRKRSTRGLMDIHVRYADRKGGQRTVRFTGETPILTS